MWPILLNVIRFFLVTVPSRSESQNECMHELYVLNFLSCCISMWVFHMNLRVENLLIQTLVQRNKAYFKCFSTVMCTVKIFFIQSCHQIYLCIPTDNVRKCIIYTWFFEIIRVWYFHDLSEFISLRDKFSSAYA